MKPNSNLTQLIYDVTENFESFKSNLLFVMENGRIKQINIETRICQEFTVDFGDHIIPPIYKLLRAYGICSH